MKSKLFLMLCIAITSSTILGMQQKEEEIQVEGGMTDYELKNKPLSIMDILQKFYCKKEQPQPIILEQIEDNSTEVHAWITNLFETTIIHKGSNAQDKCAKYIRIADEQALAIKEMVKKQPCPSLFKPWYKPVAYGATALGIFSLGVFSTLFWQKMRS